MSQEPESPEAPPVVSPLPELPPKTLDASDEGTANKKGRPSGSDSEYKEGDTEEDSEDDYDPRDDSPKRTRTAKRSTPAKPRAARLKSSARRAIALVPQTNPYEKLVFD